VGRRAPADLAQVVAAVAAISDKRRVSGDLTEGVESVAAVTDVVRQLDVTGRKSSDSGCGAESLETAEGPGVTPSHQWISNLPGVFLAAPAVAVVLGALMLFSNTRSARDNELKVVGDVYPEPYCSTIELDGVPIFSNVRIPTKTFASVRLSRLRESGASRDRA